MWLDEDRDLALAWQAEEAEKCPGCGKPHSESFDQDLEDEWTATGLRCFACKAKGRERERFTDGSADTAGLYMTVSRPDQPSP